MITALIALSRGGAVRIFDSLKGHALADSNLAFGVFQGAQMQEHVLTIPIRPDEAEGAFGIPLDKFAVLANHVPFLRPD